MDIAEVAKLNRVSPRHEENLMSVMRSGYSAAQTQTDPAGNYVQKCYIDAWDFDVRHAHLSSDAADEAWLKHRAQQPAEITQPHHRSNVEPFPVRGAKHYVAMMRAHVTSQTTPLDVILDQHRQRLAGYGCNGQAIDRDIAELRRLLTATPPTNGGTRLRKAA